MKKLLFFTGIMLMSLAAMSQLPTQITVGMSGAATRSALNTNFSSAYDSLVVHNTKILLRAPLANPVFSGIVRIGTDTLATRDYARGLIPDLSGYLTAVAISDITATGTPSSTTYLRGDGAWATPAGGGVGEITWSDTTDVIATQYDLSLIVTGEGLLATADTGTMLSVYARHSEVKQIVSDSLRAALDDAEVVLTATDTVDLVATQSYVTAQIAAGGGGSADLSGDIMIGTSRSNYLKINSELYLDSLGVQGADTVALVGIVVGDSVKIEMHPLVTASGSGSTEGLTIASGTTVAFSSSGGDFDIGFTATSDGTYTLPSGGGNLVLQYQVQDMLRDSLAVMRNILEDIYAAMGAIGVDVKAPTIDSLEIGRFADDTIRVWWSEPMVEDSIPPVSTFYLTEDDEEMGIASIYFENDSIMGIVLDSAAVYGATYLLDYTRSFPRLQDTASNSAANFTNRSVTNYMTEPEPEPENMIANGTFTSPASEWTWTAGFSIGSMVHDGSSMYQSFTQSEGAMTTAISTSTDYRLQINVTLSGANSMYFVIQSSNGGVEYGTQAYPCGNGTTTIDFTTPADIGIGGIRFRFPFEEGGSGTVNWVTLYER